MTHLNYEYFQDGNKQIHSVGCSLITNDIRKMSKSLPNDNIILFGTCSYINEAENYSKYLINFLHKCFPEYKIYANGCDVNYSKSFYEQFDKTFDNNALEEYENNIIHNDDNFVSLKIQDGCSNNCSYCIINQLRNNPHSISLENILEQIPNEPVDIELYGTEISQYYFNGLNLIDLLDNMIKIKPNIKTISLSSIDPSSNMIEDLIKYIGKHNKIIPHLTLAVQSGSDKVINDMNRHYSQQWIRYLHLLAQEYKISIGWELIIGFPTETNDLFNETRLLFNELKPINNTIFKYSPRKGTISYKLKQIEDNIVEDRINILLNDESKWLKEAIENNPLKDYFINDKHIIPELTYNRILRKHDIKNGINIINIISDDMLINYIRSQYFNLANPSEIIINYNTDHLLFKLKFLKEFIPDTKIVVLADNNEKIDEKMMLVDFGCIIRRKE